ncbi:MAG: AbrB/MazE/SpoVT family DNA-binding domain-containing protein [Elusimicrobia bacterium]|nr:AbrB/MazE/SpoVT family DNA-binding domain-containing protein [Elusimicrobiota bacterium]MBP9128414.1 AbrB/MazE/SpoVT family DNA-binding domain-containing protein [Elusimicrobiota bacterium]MBP9698451.1 AbrB/MazE/SpoVT family DNA-binding domain-containing protein [Elusimicrobiota bacterium]
MHATVQKWGNSLAFRIPRELAKEVHVSQGSVVELKVVGEGVLFRPTRRTSWSLARMLRRVNKNTLHSETDWGQAVGREVW